MCESRTDDNLNHALEEKKKKQITNMATVRNFEVITDKFNIDKIFTKVRSSSQI
jgi:hypothetical protein